MASTKRGKKTAGVDALGRKPSDLPEHKCGHHGHKNKRGAWCGQNHLEGTTACGHHGGLPLVEQKATGLIRIEYDRWRLSGHDGAGIDPAVEILRMIAFWKWKADLYGGLIAQAHAAAEQLRAAHEAGQLLLADEQTETRFKDGEYAGEIHEHPALQVARDQLEQVFITGGVTALVGHKYDVDRDGRVFAVDEGIRGLVDLEMKAHTMLAKVCALAVQAKVAETRIALAEQTGLLIQSVILGVLRDMGVPATDDRVRQLVVSHIDRAVSGPLALNAA